MSPRVRGAGAAAVSLVLLVALAACGGGGESSGRPSLSASPSRTLPSATRSPGGPNGPTGEPSASKTAAPSPTAAPTKPNPSRSRRRHPRHRRPLRPRRLRLRPRRPLRRRPGRPDVGGRPDADDGGRDAEAQPVSGAGSSRPTPVETTSAIPSVEASPSPGEAVRGGGPGREWRGRPVLGLVAARRPSGGRCGGRGGGRACAAAPVA